LLLAPAAWIFLRRAGEASEASYGKYQTAIRIVNVGFFSIADRQDRSNATLR